MGCASCGVTKNGVPQGCGDKGHCTSGSCNKKNTYDWLTTLDMQDPMSYGIVEVSFKKGNRKSFYFNPDYSEAITGDMVVVESSNGYDVGRISLSGDLVRLQMKKVNHDESKVIYKIIRIANRRDLEKLEEARSSEKRVMIKARQITRTLDVNMKIGDVEFQGDKRKATFYYTADGRVDFRELVRMYAKEFRVKIEMKQIGSRQESAIIGGLGTCGRELCCSTWKSDFQTVTTTAARYQNLAINQTKLTGQCGRLKCCLNYELDTYIDALKDFPKKADVIRIANGRATLVKTDIFKGIMYYAVQKDNIRGPLVALQKDQVKKILELNKKGQEIEDINSFQEQVVIKEEDVELEFADVTGEIELPEIKRRKKKRNNRNRDNRSNKGPRNKGPRNKTDGKPKSKGNGPQDKKPKSPNNKSENKSQNKSQSTTKPSNNPNSKGPNKNKSRYKKRRGPSSKGPNNKGGEGNNKQKDNNNNNKKD
jgi:cell fate regulator YaaT (PSP1 superfamily)